MPKMVNFNEFDCGQTVLPDKSNCWKNAQNQKIQMRRFVIFKQCAAVTIYKQIHFRPK